MRRDFKNILALFVSGVLLASCSKNENLAIGQVSPVIGIGYVKALHKGGDVTLQKEKLMGATQIAGIVISDRTSGNFDDHEIVIQNTNKGTTAGLVLKLNDVNTQVNFGDSVKVEIENCVVFREKGVMKVKGSNLGLAKITKVSSNNVVKYKTLSQSQLLSDFYHVENTMVRIDNISFPDLIGGAVYAGDYKISDDANFPFTLSTKTTANFAQKFLPLSASFLVIPTYSNTSSDVYNTAKMRLYMANEDAVFNETGSVYASFPEDFELATAATKNAYLMPAINDQVTFKTGAWRIYQGIIGATVNVDKFNPLGKQAIRFQQQLAESALLEMRFDLPNGASKVTFTYAVPATGTVVASTVNLEYSVDGGTTWLKTGDSVVDATKDAKEASFNVNIKGNVRFRINKLGLGLNTSIVNNGFLNIDDFKVFQNAE